MKRPIVYIAGPDVFKPNAADIYQSYARLCKDYGADCLYPNDSTIEPADTREGFASNIYSANIRMLEKADLVIINVDTYHGPSMDVGAAFEMGYATCRGIPVAGFSTQPMEPYFDRLREYHGEIVESDFGYRSKSDGLLLENFGLSDNLMIAHATGKRVHSGFEAALLEGLRLHKANVHRSTAHQAPEKDFPLWLNAFDHSNDQHAITLQKLRPFLDGIKQTMPSSWRNLEQLNVLDLACGDGRFSRRVVDLLENKLELKVNYVAVELNPKYVRRAQARFPEGVVLPGNIFEELGQFIPAGFTPHLTLLFHAIYFAEDTQAYVEKLANVGTAETVTLYLLNDPIYRNVPKYIDKLVEALGATSLSYCASTPFQSHVYFPHDAKKHLARLTVAPATADLDENGEKTRRLLSFFQQTPLAQLDDSTRFEYLDRVQRDLAAHKGKIPFQNHCVAALRPDASEDLKQMVECAIRNTNLSNYLPPATSVGRGRKRACRSSAVNNDAAMISAAP